MSRLSLLAAFAVSSIVFAQDKIADSPYFPAAEGTVWTYRLGEKKITIKAVRHEKQAGVMAVRLDTSDLSGILAYQHVAVAADTVKRVAHNGEKVDPALVLLKLPPAKGQAWDVDSKMTSRSGVDAIQGKFTTDEDDVKVPAGDYKKAIRVTAELTVNGQPTKVTSWYADKVGLVKQRIALGGQSYEMDLEKIEFPK